MFQFKENNFKERLKIFIEKNDDRHNKVSSIINSFLTGSLSEKEETEIRQVGNFIVVSGENIRLLEKREAPDFIIEQNGKKIGLEVERIFNPDVVQNIKSKKELFDKAAIKFESTFPHVKLLANFWLDDSFTFHGSQKSSLIQEICNFIYEVSSGNAPTSPSYIKEFQIMEHSGVCFNFNAGAYFVKDLPNANLIKAIEKKEEKVAGYISNTGIDSQWLLLVSGIGAESFRIDTTEMTNNIKSQFEHIYLLEDFLLEDIDPRVTKIK
jgi:hypothetical protein